MNFWLAVANEKTDIPDYPEGWRWNNMFDEGSTLYTLGQKPQSFRDARIGDIVFAYQTTEGIIAVARIAKEFHKEDGDEGITLVPVGKGLKRAIPWPKVSEVLSVKSWEIRLTLLQIGHEEAHELIKLIEQDGNPEVTGELRELVG